jgi:GNAT superfamily N-acetyltransferase
MNIRIRPATMNDIPILREVIEASVRGLQSEDYSPSQIEGALQSVYGVDSQLISDGTYLVAEALGSQTGTPQNNRTIIGCGGWSKRKTLYGGDQYTDRQDSLLDPAYEAAKIRAFFIHPSWARRGVGGLILEACETGALNAGFTRLEMGATLSGVAFYQAKGYTALENLEVPLANGESLPIVRMAKKVVVQT